MSWIQELDAHSEVCTSTPLGPSPSSSSSTPPPPSSPKKAPFEITPSVAKGRSPSPSPPRPWGSTSSLIPPSS
eukprot:Em0016g514a